VTRLGDTKALVQAALKVGSGKLTKLFAELAAIGFDGSPGSPRVVIFSERICTLDMLKEALASRLKMKPLQIECYTASGNTQEKVQREIIESFGRVDSPLRVLLCSDAASEGVNLHHQCHHLFHYDVPWSIIRLTQRNGRIDRFGQRYPPQLRYLLTQTKARTADQRVVERLIEKEREIERQLGDSGALLGLYDADSEEEFLLRGVARGDDAEALVPDNPLAQGKAATELVELGVPADANASGPAATTSTGAVDLLALFAAVQREQAQTPGLEKLVENPKSLFRDDYELLVAALRHLERHSVVGAEPIKWSHNDKDNSVEVFAPEPFRRHREGFLPREAVPEKDSPYRLAMGRELVTEKLRAALDDEGRWPDWHLLWEQHPIVEWLLDALGSAYARGEAPLLRIPALGKEQSLFLLQGMMFNHESEAVEARWLGLSARGDAIAEETLDLDGVIARVGLSQALVNSGQEAKRAPALQKLVPKMVTEARERVTRGRKEHVKTDLMKRARHETRRLDAWAAKSLELIASDEHAWAARDRKIPKHIQDRLHHEREHVAHVEANHQQLLKSVQAIGEPYVRVVAVFSGE
jgi:hypothetical protein